MALYNVYDKKNKEDNYFMFKIRKFKSIEELEKSGKYRYKNEKTLPNKKLEICRTLVKGTNDSVTAFNIFTEGIKYRKNSTIAFEVTCSVSDDTRLDTFHWKDSCLEFLEHYFGNDNVLNVWYYNPKLLENNKEQSYITALIIPLITLEDGSKQIKFSHYINNEKNIAYLYDKFSEAVKYLGLKRGAKGYRKPRKLSLPAKTMQWTIERVEKELPTTVAKPDDWADWTLFEKYTWCNTQRNLQKWCMDAINVYSSRHGDIKNFTFTDMKRNNFFASTRLNELKEAEDYCGVWLLVILSVALINRNAELFNEKFNQVIDEIGFLEENVYDYLTGIDLSFLEKETSIFENNF